MSDNDEVPKHRKRRGGKRPFAIEYRLAPGKCGNRLFGKEWKVMKRYKTEARRDEALRALHVGGVGSSAIMGGNFFEHRKAE